MVYYHGMKSCAVIGLVALLLMTGCSSMNELRSDAEEKYKDGWFAACHEIAEETSVKQIPFTLRIADLASKPSSSRTMPGAVLVFFPIASIFASGETVNMVKTPFMDIPLEEMELESLLVEELRHRSLFKDVMLGSGDSDFLLTGTINYTFRGRDHLSGLGIAFPLMGWPTLALPMKTVGGSLDAEVQIVSAKTGNVVMAGKYRFEDKNTYWLLGEGHPLDGGVCEVLFPQLVDALQADIASVPTGHWKEQDISARGTN